MKIAVGIRREPISDNHLDQEYFPKMDFFKSNCMNKIRLTMASTRLDRHYCMIAKSALEQEAERIQNGKRVLFTIEHDRTVPPIGKIINAWVEEVENGEFELIGEVEIFDKMSSRPLSDGSILLRQESEVDASPFANPYDFIPDGLHLSYDFVNFEKGDFEKFLDEVREESNSRFDTSLFGRKSYIPDPELIISLVGAAGLSVGAGIVLKKVAEKALEKVSDQIGDDVAKIYSFIRATVIAAFKYAIPKNRPHTFVFLISKTPLVECIAVSNDPAAVLSAAKIEVFESMIQDASSLVELFEADRVQYLLNEEGQWEINYLLTKKGEVIGTEKSFSRQTKKFELSKKMLEMKQDSDNNALLDD